MTNQQQQRGRESITGAVPPSSSNSLNCTALTLAALSFVSLAGKVEGGPEQAKADPANGIIDGLSNVLVPTVFSELLFPRGTQLRSEITETQEAPTKSTEDADAEVNTSQVRPGRPEVAEDRLIIEAKEPEPIQGFSTTDLLGYVKGTFRNITEFLSRVTTYYNDLPVGGQRLLQWLGVSAVGGAAIRWINKKFAHMSQQLASTQRGNDISFTSWELVSDVPQAAYFDFPPTEEGAPAVKPRSFIHPRRESSASIGAACPGTDLLIKAARNRQIYVAVEGPEKDGKRECQYTCIGLLDLKGKVNKTALIQMADVHHKGNETLTRLARQGSPYASTRELGQVTFMSKDEFRFGNGRPFADYDVVRADKFDFTVIEKLIEIMDSYEQEKSGNKAISLEEVRLDGQGRKLFKVCPPLREWASGLATENWYQGEIPYRFIMAAHILRSSGITSDKFKLVRYIDNPDFGGIAYLSTPIPSGLGGGVLK